MPMSSYTLSEPPSSIRQSTSGLVARWEVAPSILSYVVLLPPPDASTILGEYAIDDRFEDSTSGEGVWRQFAVLQNDIPVSIYVYRRRLIAEISVPPEVRNEKSSLRLDSSIRWAVDSSAADTIWGAVLQLIPSLNVELTTSIPMLLADYKPKRHELVRWQSDGATTFMLRMYDSVIGRQAVVRVSRHLVAVLGGSGRLRQEVVNLIYEKVLYSDPGTGGVAKESVFAFIDGLSRYTVPTENNVFLQREFARLGLLIGWLQIVLGVWSVAMGGHTSSIELAIGVAILMCIALASFVVIRRLSIVRWE